jgi:hypothetical protein
MNENSSSTNQLEKTFKDSLVGEEVLVNKIKQDILDGVSSSQRTEELIQEASQENKAKDRFYKVMGWVSKGKVFYEKHKKVILMVLFFVLFWKLILLILWILI